MAAHHLILTNTEKRDAIWQAINVKLIDIRSAFLARRDYRDYLSDDGIHPNEQGHLMISKNVLQQI